MLHQAGKDGNDRCEVHAVGEFVDLHAFPCDSGEPRAAAEGSLDRSFKTELEGQQRLVRY